MDGIKNIFAEGFKTKDIKRKLILSLIYLVVTGLIYLVTKLTGLIFSVNLIFIHITLRGLCFGLFLLAAIWIIYALSLILDARKKIIPRVIISLIIAAIVLFTAFAGLMIGLGADTYYEFISDDGKNIAVVSEYNFLFSTTLNMYKRENLFFLRKIEDDFFTGDQGYVLGSDACETEWNGAVFKIEIHQRFGPYNYEYNLNDY
ncbi:hypothetical protein [Fenollaria massiliensis]|uniref:hypothetical protein n=1 Tax=Fenollaria massiliensis TaxID=938288 RepID=UPI00036963E2|nr:hypothetical protein [Fenollaria massiliensis]